MLLEKYHSRLLKLILESNEKRKEEMKDKSIAEEVEKVKKIAETLQEEITTKSAKTCRKPPA